MEQELLAIIETLKEFKGMLWGQNITFYIDHKKSNAGCSRPDL